MAFNSPKGLVILLVSASVLANCMANKDWHLGFNYTGWSPKNGSYHLNYTNDPRKIIVGGSDQWRFGFNYSEWAFKNGPYYVNDTLVFKYDPPNGNTTFPHSVYLLPNAWSYMACDLKRAKLIANATQGGGDGFEFVLKRWQPYYFACGERNGIHCRDGHMRFFVMPMLRRWHY